MLGIELKKIIFSPHYLICIIFLYFLLMVGTVGFWDATLDGKAVSMLAHFFDAWHDFGNVYIVVPILVTVPITFLLHDELNSGYFYFSVTRSKKRKYIFIKMIAGIISGIIMILLAELLFTITLFCIMKGTINFDDQQNFFGASQGADTIFTGLLKAGNGHIIYIILSILAGLYGGVFSALAVAVSAVAKNKYIATVIPFLIFLIVENCFYKIMNMPDLFAAGFESIYYPSHDYEWMGGIPLSICIFLFWTAISTIIFYFMVLRKIRGK